MLEAFESVGYIVWKVQGKSMQPMLSPNRDIAIIRKKNNLECLEENDVVLYKRNEHFVLHRIIKKEIDSYTLLGDNCSKPEKGIRENDILGVLVAFIHNGKHYDVDNEYYLEYVKNVRLHEKARARKKTIIDFFTPESTRWKYRIKDLLIRVLKYELRY